MMTVLKPVLAFLILFGIVLSSRPAAAEVHWWNDAVFYEVFVRSFYDSNGDGVGDLRGLTSHLGYLNAGTKKSLGINAIWLMPIFKSPSYHGYDTVDFKSINPAYGTLEDFDRFIHEAHARHVHVILDLALNHTSNLHPWFTASAKDPESRAGRLYNWSKTRPDWQPDRWHPLNKEYYYGYFGAPLPDLNWRNPDVMEAMKDILRFWIAHGVDGFRFDAVRYLVEGARGESDTPETHRVIQELTRWVKSKYPSVYFVGEVWADAATIAPYVNSGVELDQCFNFPMSGGIVTSLASASDHAFRASFADVAQKIKTPASLGNFLTNHDQVRVASLVQSNLEALKLGAVALMTLPGTPIIYYGEELGLPNGPMIRGDLSKRTPMMWNDSANFGFTEGPKPWEPFSSGSAALTVANEAADPHSLLNIYSALIGLRLHEAALRRGGFEFASLADGASPFVFGRRFGIDLILTFLNFSGQNLALTTAAIKAPTGTTALDSGLHATALYGHDAFKYTQKNGMLSVQVQDLGPQKAMIIKFSKK